MHSDVDEGPERGHVGDDALEHHARAQVLGGVDVFGEAWRLENRPRVSAWAGQLRDDVLQRGQPNAFADVAVHVDGLGEGAVPHQRGEGAAQLRRHALHQGVALGVHSRAVQGVLSVLDAQKASALLEGPRPQPRHLQQRPPPAEGALRVPVGHDLVGQRRPHAGHPGQQRRARRVQLHAHAVDAALHHLVELALQQLGVDVVLVLPHAERLGLHLDQLGEGILQPPRDGHRAAQRDIHAWQLGARQLRGAVDAGAGLVDRHDHGLAEPTFSQRCAQETFRLPPRRAVAYGDEARAVSADEITGLLSCLGAASRGPVWVDRSVLQKLPRPVDHRALAASAQPWIHTQHGVGAQRGAQQQAPQVVGEDLHRRAVCPLLERAPHLVVDRGRQQPLVAVGDRRLELASEGRAPAVPHRVHQACDDPLGVDLDAAGQHAHAFAPADSERPVRGQPRHGLGEVEVVLVLAGLRVLGIRYVDP